MLSLILNSSQLNNIGIKTYSSKQQILEMCKTTNFVYDNGVTNIQPSMSFVIATYYYSITIEVVLVYHGKVIVFKSRRSSNFQQNYSIQRARVTCNYSCSWASYVTCTYGSLHKLEASKGSLRKYPLRIQLCAMISISFIQDSDRYHCVHIQNPQNRSLATTHTR